MSSIKKEIKYYPKYGLCEVVDETPCFYILKKYKCDNIQYMNYTPSEYNYLHEYFYVFSDELCDYEIKLSKKNFLENYKNKAKSYFLKNGDVYEINKQYNTINIKEDDDLFYHDKYIRCICIHGHRYCKNLEKNSKYINERYLEFLGQLNFFYENTTLEEKKYIKRWFKKNIKQYNSEHDLDLPDLKSIKSFFKVIKNV